MKINQVNQDMHELASWLLQDNGMDSSVLSRYKEPHRHYHSWNHIEDMLKWLIINKIEDKSVFLATIFHDIVYDPKAKDNEEKSAELFNKLWKGDIQTRKEVVKMILDTKTHIAFTELSEKLIQADLNIFSKPLNEIIAYDKQIFKEYQFVDWNKYREGRLEVLEKLRKHFNNTHQLNHYGGVMNLIDYFKSFQPKIGVFTGSFNPYHIGHQNILEKAEKVFDKVIIARGINPEKKDGFRMLPKILEYHQKENYSGLITDFIKELEYPVTLVRGLRNTKDFEYELTMSQYIKDINKGVDVPTALFVCDREFNHVSSSAIKQLPKKEQEKYIYTS